MGHGIQSPVRRLTLLNLEIFRLKEEDKTRTTFHLKLFSKPKILGPDQVLKWSEKVSFENRTEDNRKKLWNSNGWTVV